ncbi:MAG: hypothetical protein D6702_11680 [Planctomycetota bacterium]|nr:MAG: hypothetical protein D6702_11680 [Planctomycetota bacterium]
MRRRTETALVLRRWPWSEHSLALRVLTPGSGVVPLLAKGVFKPTSGKFGVLDTWALVEIEYGGPDDAELLNLYRCRLLDRMSGLSADPERLIVAAVAAELAELAAPPEPAASFHYLLETLHHLANGEPTEAAALRAALAGLDLLGLGPVLEAGPDPPAAGRRWFAAAEGGLLPAGSPRPAGACRSISPAELALLRAVRAGDRTAAAEADSAVRRACLTILGDFLHYHLERPPRAWAFLVRRRPTAAAR